jgi:hypothetical protein
VSSLSLSLSPSLSRKGNARKERKKEDEEEEMRAKISVPQKVLFFPSKTPRRPDLVRIISDLTDFEETRGCVVVLHKKQLSFLFVCLFVQSDERGKERERREKQTKHTHKKHTRH